MLPQKMFSEVLQFLILSSISSEALEESKLMLGETSTDVFQTSLQFTAK